MEEEDQGSATGKKYSLPQSQNRASEKILKQSAGLIYVDKCPECGKKVELNFKPDGARPVYCKDCLIKVRAQAPSPQLKMEAPKKIVGEPARQHFPVPRSFSARSVAGEPVIKESGPTISLSQATGRRIPEPARPQVPKPFIKKPRPELNLEDLRSALKDVVRPDDKLFSSAQIKPGETKPQPDKIVPNPVSQQQQNNEVKDLKPGEEAEL